MTKIKSFSSIIILFFIEFNLYSNGCISDIKGIWREYAQIDNNGNIDYCDSSDCEWIISNGEDKKILVLRNNDNKTEIRIYKAGFSNSWFDTTPDSILYCGEYSAIYDFAEYNEKSKKKSCTVHYFNKEGDDMLFAYSYYSKENFLPYGLMNAISEKSKKDKHNYINDFLKFNIGYIRNDNIILYDNSLKRKLEPLKHSMVMILDSREDFYKIQYYVDENKLDTCYIKKSDIILIEEFIED